MNDQAGSKSHELVCPSHFLAVAAGKIIVYSNDMHALTCKRVKVCGHGCNESLSFTRFHFGNSALMKNYTSKHLHAERSLTEYAKICLADSRKGIGQNIVKSFTGRKARLERGGYGGKLLVCHFAVSICKGFDSINSFLQLFHLSLAVRADYLIQKSHLFYLHKDLNKNIHFIISLQHAFCYYYL